MPIKTDARHLRFSKEFYLISSFFLLQELVILVNWYSNYLRGKGTFQKSFIKNNKVPVKQMVSAKEAN